MTHNFLSISFSLSICLCALICVDGVKDDEAAQIGIDAVGAVSIASEKPKTAGEETVEECGANSDLVGSLAAANEALAQAQSALEIAEAAVASAQGQCDLAQQRQERRLANEARKRQLEQASIRSAKAKADSLSNKLGRISNNVDAVNDNVHFLCERRIGRSLNGFDTNTKAIQLIISTDLANLKAISDLLKKHDAAHAAQAKALLVEAMGAWEDKWQTYGNLLEMPDIGWARGCYKRRMDHFRRETYSEVEGSLNAALTLLRSIPFIHTEIMNELDAF